ncbi:MAG: hypothetical protein ACRDRA_13825, partial [Pseudonocardiaceae bacterium]
WLGSTQRSTGRGLVPGRISSDMVAVIRQSGCAISGDLEPAGHREPRVVGQGSTGDQPESGVQTGDREAGAP